MNVLLCKMVNEKSALKLSIYYCSAVHFFKVLGVENVQKFKVNICLCYYYKLWYHTSLIIVT